MSERDQFTDEPMERLIEAAREHYNDPPTLDADAMWNRVAPKLRTVPRRWSVSPWLAAAAALVLWLGGIGLGRWTAPTADVGSEVAQATGSDSALTVNDAPPTTVAGSTAVLRFAAYQHLSETGSFLERFDTAGAGDVEVARWGKRLLTDTRLLLDTSVSDDADLRRLLEDLELILAQVVQLAGDRDAANEALELEQLNQGLEEQRVLPRIREILPPVLSAAD